MAFNLLGGVVKAVGNVVESSVQNLEDIVQPGKGSKRAMTIIGGNSIAEAGTVRISSGDDVVVLGPVMFVVPATEIPDGSIGVDMLAPSTIDRQATEVRWNGYYVKGLFRILAELQENGATITILPPTPKVDYIDDVAEMIESNPMMKD